MVTIQVSLLKEDYRLWTLGLEPSKTWIQLTHDHDVEFEALLHGLLPHLLQDGVDAHIAEVQHRTSTAGYFLTVNPP